MKKKLQEKKGFTLVELMIVVVIMGILVAVAIPVYNSVTKNVKAKACDSNIRIMKENFGQYQMTGNNGAEVAAADLVTQFNAKDGAAVTTGVPAYAKLFDGGKVPTCPLGGEYTFAVVNEDGVAKLTVTCPNAADHQ